jgi:hypothetical protein
MNAMMAKGIGFSGFFRIANHLAWAKIAAN